MAATMNVEQWGEFGTCSSSSSNGDVKSSMIDQISVSTSCFFRSQQRGDPDLTVAEKREIAETLLNKDPVQFLARYGTVLKQEHLTYFEPLEDNYEIAFHMKTVRERLDETSASRYRVKNRRFEALRRMIEEKSSYFSESEMRRRNPLLYEQLIGPYLTPDEREKLDKETFAENQESLVDLLMARMDANEELSLKKTQENTEDEEEFDSDSESEVEMEEDKDFDDGDEFIVIPEAEKTLLRQEFMSTMFQNFLHGRDREFDYSAVDTNADLDSLDVINREAEERYFSEEDEQKEDEQDIVTDIADATDEPDDLDKYMATLQDTCEASISKPFGDKLRIT